jgi:hypothetical protein
MVDGLPPMQALEFKPRPSQQMISHVLSATKLGHVGSPGSILGTVIIFVLGDGERGDSAAPRYAC